MSKAIAFLPVLSQQIHKAILLGWSSSPFTTDKYWVQRGMDNFSRILQLECDKPNT
jgi:hypothetical protein